MRCCREIAISTLFSFVRTSHIIIIVIVVAIRYLGEKLALYFEFVAHYSTWLLPLSLGGLVVCFDLAIEAIVFDSAEKALLSGLLFTVL